MWVKPSVTCCLILSIFASCIVGADERTNEKVAVCNSAHDKNDVIRNAIMPRIVNNLLEDYHVDMSQVYITDISTSQSRNIKCLITHGKLNDLKSGDHAWGIGITNSNKKLSVDPSLLHLHAIRGYKTRNQLGLRDGFALGDPLILSGLLLKNSNSIDNAHCETRDKCRYNICNVAKAINDTTFSNVKIRSRRGDKKEATSSFTFFADQMPLEALLQCRVLACSSASCTVLGTALGFPARCLLNLYHPERDVQVADFMTSMLGPYGETLDMKIINKDILQKSQAALLKSFPHQLFPKQRTFRVFLDHGGLPYHSEVFFSVATLVMRIHNRTAAKAAARGEKSVTVMFLISHSFAMKSGLKVFWERYQAGRTLGAELKWVDLDSYYKPIMDNEGVCGSDEATKATLQYDLRVVVTIPASRARMIKTCFTPYANRSDHMIVIHRPHQPEHRQVATEWNNSFIATQASAIGKFISAERLFTPSLMPIPPAPPDCSSARPVVMVQGAVATKRVRTELLWLLAPKYDFNVTVRILTRQDPPLDLLEYMADERMEYRMGLDMVGFHEAFLGAAFILPLIMPGNLTITKSYVNGHPTSSIAYGMHFQLRFISHRIVYKAYKVEMLGRTSYWHDGSETDFVASVRSALSDYSAWCSAATSNSKRSVW
jgi:hypothetical protein